MMVNVNNKGYIGTAVTLNLNATASWDSSSTSYATAANRAGKDVYIYVCEQDGDIPKILLSANSTVPAGYTAATSRKIGGFHCLCLSVGTISGHQLSGYNTGDILPLSVWDLKQQLPHPVAEGRPGQVQLRRKPRVATGEIDVQPADRPVKERRRAFHGVLRQALPHVPLVLGEPQPRQADVVRGQYDLTERRWIVVRVNHGTALPFHRIVWQRKRRRYRCGHADYNTKKQQCQTFVRLFIPGAYGIIKLYKYRLTAHGGNTLV